MERLIKMFSVAVMIFQTIFHYLGLIGIILGIVALVFGNTARGVELLIGGFGFIAMKYLIGLLFFFVIRFVYTNSGVEEKNTDDDIYTKNKE